MNGCDRLDQLVSYCNIVDRKTIKCWNRVFSWVIEVTKINAYILFELSCAEGHKQLTLKKFKENLVNDLQKSYDCDKVNKANKESKRQKTERVVPYVENDQNCAVFIGLAKCRKTNVICIGCEVSHIYIQNVAMRHVIVKNTRDQETLRHLLQLYILLMFDI